MEEFESVMFEEEDFEVVDECICEDDPAVMENDKPEDAGTKEKSMETEEKPVAETPPSDSMDFTADVSIEHSELETTVDSTIDTSEVTVLSEKDDSEEVTVIEVKEIRPEDMWYEEKLEAKKTIVKDRLTKLARFIELTYPESYKTWLDHSEDPVCRNDPPRRCPLDRPHTNRWKFLCSRKTVQESTAKEEDSAEGTVNKKLETVWQLGLSDGPSANTDNASQYPPFVMRVVKVFEEFINSIDHSLDDEEPVESSEKEKSTTAENEDVAKTETQKSSEKKLEKIKPEESKSGEVKSDEAGSDGANPKETTPANENAESNSTGETSYIVDRNHNWLWLVVRSNSKDELMVFATGKKISDATMQKLKQTFESGPGKDCNVKSLYCKSIYSKSGNTSTANITFLLGTEALDETVGGVKIQLAPKTNFRCNTSGVEQLGNAVGDMLSPLNKTTLIEVGCGLGLLGLMLSPKVTHLYGLDVQSEGEEAEMTGQLNDIKNAAFIMGEPAELMTKATKILQNTRAAAIINGNTKLGRDIEVMKALRKIPSLRRVAMITTLTKQSVRAILELMRPAADDLGNPFMPLRAVLVDTLPTGPHFEVVIRMERINMLKINEPWFWNHVGLRAGLLGQVRREKNPAQEKTAEENKAAQQPKKPATSSQTPTRRRANNRTSKRNKMKNQKAANRAFALGAVTGVVRNPVANPGKNGPQRSPGNLVKNPMAGKTGKTQQANNATKSMSTKSPNKKAVDSPSSPDPKNPMKIPKSNKNSNSQLKRNPLAKVPSVRGSRLSGAQRRKRHWSGAEGPRGNQGPMEKRMRGNNQGDMRGRLPDSQMVQQQLLMNMAQHGAGPLVDANTAKELQNVFKMVLDHTNKLEFSRSVWDRIAPQDNRPMPPPQAQLPRGPPREIFRDRFAPNIEPQNIIITAPNRDFAPLAPNPPPIPLFNRPIDRSKVMPAGMTPFEANRHPDRLQSRDFRRDSGGEWNRPGQFSRESREMMPQPIVRPPSPKRPLLSAPAVPSPPRGFPQSFPQDNRRVSPPRRPKSPPRRHSSPPRNPYSDIFQRRPASSQNRNSDNSRRTISPPRQSSSTALSGNSRFSGDWDRGNQQGGNWNQRDGPQRSGDRNWDNMPSSNNRFRDEKEGTWMSGGGDVWNSKQLGGNSGPGLQGDQRNSRGGKDAFPSRMDKRMDGGKDGDWSDLPDDAKDPWSRESSGNASGNNWQNKGMSSSNMNQSTWSNMNNQSNDQRWAPKNDSRKSGPSGNWMGNNSGMNDWRQQPFSSYPQLQSQQQQQQQFQQQQQYQQQQQKPFFGSSFFGDRR